MIAHGKWESKLNIHCSNKQGGTEHKSMSMDYPKAQMIAPDVGQMMAEKLHPL
jgi:hypothetical protein